MTEPPDNDNARHRRPGLAHTRPPEPTRIPRWLIYIAGPLGAEPDWQANTDRAIEAADTLSTLSENILCYVPHAMGVRWQQTRPRSYGWWMLHARAMVARSDALLRLPGLSPGADREVLWAATLGVPVFRELEPLLAWVRGGGQ